LRKRCGPRAAHPRDPARAADQTHLLPHGKFIETYPDLVRQMAADGHEFGNHSWSHPDMRKCSGEQIRRELLDTERLLNATAGATTRPFFRPPYGEYDDHVLSAAEEVGFLPVYWTLDSLDSVGKTKFRSFLVERVTNRLPEEKMRGAIVLMHCSNASTAMHFHPSSTGSANEPPGGAALAPLERSGKVARPSWLLERNDRLGFFIPWGPSFQTAQPALHQGPGSRQPHLHSASRGEGLLAVKLPAAE